MKTILVINDHSAEAGHARAFVQLMAEKNHANILIANTCNIKSKVFEKVLTKNGAGYIDNALPVNNVPGHLSVPDIDDEAFKPEIKEIDISNANETELAVLVNKEQIWLMVKGMGHGTSTSAIKINVNYLLNKVLCPLMLVPANWQIKNIERIVYIADLRYCRLHIVRYLVDMAKAIKAHLSIAHLSAKGLPHMEEKYAFDVFNIAICKNVNYDQLYFNNIRERNLSTAVDVLENGMHNDLLVLVNHRYHFAEIIGTDIKDKLPANLTVPVLVFPY
jgi:hypothetical protein